MGNPQGSALPKQPKVAKLKSDCNAHSGVLCMCMHGLVDADNGLPHKKATLLEGTVVFTNRTMKYCDGTHKHSHINGSSSKGVVKSELAQDYTNGFSKSVVADMKLFLSCPTVKPEYDCFPVLGESEDEPVDDDPYEPEIPVPKRKPLQVPQPVERPTPDPFRAAPTQSRSHPSSSSKGPDLLQTDAEDELQEALRESNRIVDNLEAETKRKKLEKRNAPPQPPVSDLVDDQPEAPIEELTIAAVKPVTEEVVKSLDLLRTNYNQRIGRGSTATIQSGQKLKLLQELFGNGSNVTVVAATIAHMPKATEPPEPMLSRVHAPLLKELRFSKDKWTQTNWVKYNTTIYSSKQRPLWAIYCYGKKNAEELTVRNP